MNVANDLLIRCTREEDAGTVTLVLRGVLVLRTAAHLRRVLTYVLDEGAWQLKVDLSGITEVDPGGLASLIIAARRLRAIPDGFRIVAVSDDCAEAMRRLHLFDEQLAEV